MCLFRKWVSRKLGAAPTVRCEEAGKELLYLGTYGTSVLVFVFHHLIRLFFSMLLFPSTLFLMFDKFVFSIEPHSHILYQITSYYPIFIISNIYDIQYFHRDTIHIEGVKLGFDRPVFFDRHAVGGEYGAGWKSVGAGRLVTTFFGDVSTAYFFKYVQ